MAQLTSDKFLRTMGAVKKVAKEKGLDPAQELTELATRLGMTESAVKSRVNQLRKKGVNIPEYPAAKRGKKFDVDALNDIAAEFGM